MDNYFQIYRPYLRHAEQTDTRAAIQQHQENRRRNQDDDERPKTDDPSFGDDEMTVSLQALTGLLKDLLKQASPKKEEDEESSHEASSDEKEADEAETNNEPVAPPKYTAEAAQAYQHAAETRGARQPVPNSPEHDPAHEMTESHDAAGMPADQIDAERVKELLNKTNRLQKAGYDHIEFVDRGDFLRSLERAIDELLKG